MKGKLPLGRKVWKRRGKAIGMIRERTVEIVTALDGLGDRLRHAY